ncbi:MAG: glycosyltransferase [Clostridiales bacterium]|nr:glycosyltransferase [Clostridiales bacterium]
MDHTQNNPEISVVLPTYNRGYILAQAIESICAQTYTNWELIVVDDGSSDDTSQVVEGIRDSRIRYIKTENQGANKARNQGVQLAKGNFIAFQDSDDLWLEHKLETQLNLLKEQQADMVFSPILIQEKNKEIKTFPQGEEKGMICYERLLTQSLGSTQTFFGRKDCFITCPFDETMPRMQDWEVLLRIARQYQVYYDDQPLALVRLQKDSISQKNDTGLLAYEKIYQKHRETIEGNQTVKEAHVLLKGHLLFQAGENPALNYKEQLKKLRGKKVKAKVWVKYVLAKTHLLKAFYVMKAKG